MNTGNETPKTQLRPRRKSDIRFLSELYASTRAEEMAIVPWRDEKKTAFVQMQFEAQSQYYDASFPEAEFSIIESGDRSIGRLYLDRREDEIRIVDIALLPEFRGKGIGGDMLRQVLTEAESQGKAVRIHVEHNNPALNLYRRLGFQHVDSNGVYYLMEWSSK